ncbi:MAG: hypothetical protein AB1422_19030, partial [bacterium]
NDKITCSVRFIVLLDCSFTTKSTKVTKIGQDKSFYAFFQPFYIEIYQHNKPTLIFANFI